MSTWFFNLNTNMLKLLKKLYVPMSFKIRVLLMLTIRPILHYLALENKDLRIMYICRGIMDGIKNINGKYYEKRWNFISLNDIYFFCKINSNLLKKNK